MVLEIILGNLLADFGSQDLLVELFDFLLREVGLEFQVSTL